MLHCTGGGLKPLSTFAEVVQWVLGESNSSNTVVCFLWCQLTDPRILAKVRATGINCVFFSFGSWLYITVKIHGIIHLSLFLGKTTPSPSPWPFVLILAGLEMAKGTDHVLFPSTMDSGDMDDMALWKELWMSIKTLCIKEQLKEIKH